MRRSRYLLISLLALAAVAPLSTGVFADGSASTQFTVNAQAPNVCSMPSPQTTGTAMNATFAGSAVNITQFIDPNNAKVVASTLSLQYPGTLCNYSTTLSIQSKGGGLVSSNAIPVASGAGTFLQNVPYTIQASWGPVNLLLDTNWFKRQFRARRRQKQWRSIRQPDAQLRHGSEFVASSPGHLSGYGPHQDRNPNVSRPRLPSYALT